MGNMAALILKAGLWVLLYQDNTEPFGMVLLAIQASVQARCHPQLQRLGVGENSPHPCQCHRHQHHHQLADPKP